MQEKINKFIWIIVFVLLMGSFCFLIYNEASFNKLNTFEKRIYYLDNYIYIKIYSGDEKKANEALESVTNIYKKYHELTDRNNGYPGLKNIYYIHNNNEDSEYLEIDSRLYDILEYSLSWYQESNELFDIRIGDLTDFYSNNDKLLSKDELNNIFIRDIILKDGKILNNHSNIDLSGIVKGYTNQIVSEYLESIGIDRYLINAGGNILVGKHYKNDKYTIGIENPMKNDASISLKVSLEEKTVVTKGNYQTNLTIDNKKYMNIINPKTKYPSDNYLSVTVIADDSRKADIISNILPLLPLDEALEYVNSKEGIEAMFYISEDEQIMSNNFNIYIKE